MQQKEEELGQEEEREKSGGEEADMKRWRKGTERRRRLSKLEIKGMTRRGKGVGNNSWPLTKASHIKMQSKAGINMEPWGTPLVLINTSYCLSELCYLLHCTVYTIVILVGDRKTTNLPLRWHLHLGIPKMLESLLLLFSSPHALMELLEPWSKELHM